MVFGKMKKGVKKGAKKTKKGVTKGAKQAKKAFNIVEDLGKALFTLVKAVIKIIPSMAGITTKILNGINNNRNYLGLLILFSPFLLAMSSLVFIRYILKNKEALVKMNTQLIANDF